MTLDGLVKLNDARLKSATVRAEALSIMADVAVKHAQAGKIIEETLKLRLENIAKALDITWDAQAHRHLLRIRDIALRAARLERQKSREIREQCGRLGRLLLGHGSWPSIRDAWIAFNYCQSRITVEAAIATNLAPDVSAFDPNSWAHPDRKVTCSPEGADLGGLWAWAARHTYFPRPSTGAWNALARTLQVMSQSAAGQAAALEAKADQLAEEARELSQIDWDRLKTS